ncbi:hypothetical protein [Haloferula rosea]|uniref:Uncharacterized protein n=1 Tax=Haloferula rosea TaxID=490093 RepID=A0A934R961_9BACT|nr:hypothetical protein [Haloferula rosea]MBK1827504.1 hypothetical protein [Haloferula rosea]
MAVLALLTSIPGEALQIRSRDKSVVGEFQRVFGPQGTSTIVNPQFVPNASLFCGMGWPGHPTEWYRNYSLVSPVHFIGAAHYLPDLSWKIRFLGMDGVLRDYEILELDIVKNADDEATDLFIGTLKQPVDLSQIKPFGVFTPADEVYVGKEAIVFGKVGEAMKRAVDGEWALQNSPGFDTTRLLYFDYDPGGTNPKDIHYQGGDSGSPAFVIVEGQPTILGVASTLDQVSGKLRSSMSLVPAYVNEIDEIMEAKGYHLTRVDPVPEGGLSAETVAGANLRQSQPGGVALRVSNSGNEELHNLRIRVSGTAQPDQVTGTGWISVKQEDGSWECRLAGLATNASTSVSVVWNSLPAGLSLQWSVSADGITERSFEPTILIQGPLVSPHGEEGSALDSDGDGVSDLLEDAFGGNPAIASSRNLVGAPLLPVPDSSEDQLSYTFTRRDPSAEEGRFYLIEFSRNAQGWSGDLPPGTRTEARPFAPVWSGFEQVELQVPQEAGAGFLRLRYQVVD